VSLKRSIQLLLRPTFLCNMDDTGNTSQCSQRAWRKRRQTVPKLQRRQARANKQKLLQTPSPQQERPFYLSKIYVCNTQPSLDLQTVDSDNESSSSVTVPDTPPSLHQRLLSKLRGSDSESVAEIHGESLQHKLFSVAESPCNDELKSKLEGMSDISVVTSHKSAEMSAADEVQSGLSRMSQQPLAAVLPCSNSDPVKTITVNNICFSIIRQSKSLCSRRNCCFFKFITIGCQDRVSS